MPIITREYWNRSAYVTIQASPPFDRISGGNKRLAPPGVSKYIRGLTTYRFSAVPALFYQIRRGSARNFIQ